MGDASDATVGTGAGPVRGRCRDGVYSFKGVPYAAAPEGPLRFRPPAPRAGWDGVRDCTEFGVSAPQAAPALGIPAVWQPEAGLDCLTLNVWTPEPGATGLPVLVWIHGGLWKHGSSSMPQYDGATLAGSGVVVVSVNYRLGFEGFGHLPGVVDNRGLLDQIAALEWVRREIAGFGGDPGNVTLFGQSAGAASTVLLLGAPAAAGLFRRAIAQSIPVGQRSEAEAETVTAKIAVAAGVPATLEGFAGLAPEAILAVQDAPLTKPEDGLTAFGPVIDGRLVTGPPWSAIGSGAGRDVDLVCGFTHEESRGLGPGPARVNLEIGARMLGLPTGSSQIYRAANPGASNPDVFGVMVSDALIRMPTITVAEAHAAAGGRTWLYDFAWAGRTIGAGHGVEIPFIFGNPGSRYASRFLGTPPAEDFGPLAEKVRAAWIAFAATGDPGWPRYDTERRLTRIWNSTVTDVSDPLARSRRNWER